MRGPELSAKPIRSWCRSRGSGQRETIGRIVAGGLSQALGQQSSSRTALAPRATSARAGGDVAPMGIRCSGHWPRGEVTRLRQAGSISVRDFARYATRLIAIGRVVHPSRPVKSIAEW